MTFYEKVNALCLDRGTSITAVATELGYSQSAPTTWKNSKGLPRASTLKKLSEFFDVPMSYFLGTSDPQIKNAPEEENLSEGEKMLLAKFRRLSPEKQEALIQLLGSQG